MIDHARTLAALARRLDGYHDRVDRTIAADDAMHRGDVEDYLSVGFSAVAGVAGAMAQTGRTELGAILDFPCGHGRVLRALAAAFPEAALTACDVDRSGVAFCAERFGATPVVSDPDPEAIPLEGAFDLIFVGSLLTHLDAPRWADFIDLWRRHLAPGGLLVLSTHGRNAVQRWRRIEDPRVKRLVAGFAKKGFAYEDHPGVLGYGTSASSAAWVLRLLRRWEDLMVVGYVERGLADHQDLVCLLKLDVHHPQNALILR